MMPRRMEQEESIDVEALVNEFEKKLDRLKVLYEQYFMGIEKREPLVPLKDVARVMRALEQVSIRNTGVRFRYRTLVQRFNVFRTYWSRISREIEKGTYFRDVARASRNLAKKGITMPTTGRMRTQGEVERAFSDAVQKNEAPSLKSEDLPKSTLSKSELSTSDLSTSDAPASQDDGLPQIDIDEEVFSALHKKSASTLPDPPKPSQEPSQPPAVAAKTATPIPSHQAQSKISRPAPPPALKEKGISEEQLQSIYRRFVKAKKLCGEDTSSIHFESLAKSIIQQIPKIQKQNPGKEIEFQVVVRNGRAIIRANSK
jgi:hypothetical protein